ncbi:MAG: pyruvate, water dikinase [Deltaproteobacteria bacterium]|nr:pyruvate, water dikinase [Deltaproteobacteria bacterium]
MGGLPNIFKMFFAKKRKKSTEEVEALRVDFKQRYHHFKLLLSANNKSLEIMADIEQILFGERPFGMSYIRANCTAVSVNVFRMITNLERLAPGKYGALTGRFNEIKGGIDNLLVWKADMTDKRLVIALEDVDSQMADFVGSKMANLGELRRHVDIQIPSGFAITAAAFQHFVEYNDLQTEISRRIQAADADNIEDLYTLSAELQQLIIRSKMPADLSQAVKDAWEEVESKEGKGITAALRSSALGEDVAGSSFAGQYRSELNVSVENFFQAYKEILASKYSLAAISYRLNRGFRDEDVSMCVGCMTMVDAKAGGVIYSRNPVDMRDNAISVNAVWGLPKSVVDGSGICDIFIVSRKTPMTIVKQEIREKNRKYVCRSTEGVSRLELSGPMRDQPSITEQQVFQLARIALDLEAFYNRPQDIEWAIDFNDTIFILQCRPLQQIETVEKKVLELPVTMDGKTIISQGGITASPGIACGKIFYVDKGGDMLGFPQGGVLVASQALPRWAPLLNRAAAVLTEQGGFAGHLANVAREFGVPALFGISGITDRMENGELVTVDAEGCTVYQGRIDSILGQSSPKRNLMAGSPVYRIMQEASRSIVPLNLLNPDAIDFVPSKCLTFHDITRFIHEKAVHEMFNFGREHDFLERSSKQLYYNVPMQWWVLNLDDGFREEVRRKYVRLDNIVSIPMLSFWEGFAAVPWDGPPGIDGKGLMSVMFQSTVNPALNPGVRSRFADRNYFMISKNFCSLSSRLGYHFSTMEALVSERAMENYISFQFKGGAANDHRRIKRVHFIREILDEYGFRTEAKEDHLSARVEGYEMDAMQACLKILGYLTLHTRQLDVIMANADAVDYYRNKIKKDIQTVISPVH